MMNKVYVVIFFLAIFLFQSCVEDSTVDSGNEIVLENSSFDSNETIYTQNAFLEDIKLPNNTKITKLDDSTLSIELPEGYRYQDKNNGKNSVGIRSFEYTCTCSRAGGCSVFQTTGGKFGCQDDSCNAVCSGSLGSGVIIHYSAGVNFITDLEAINELPSLDGDLLNMPMVREAIAKFNRDIYGKDFMEITKTIDNLKNWKYETDEYLPVTINIFGYKAEYVLANYKILPQKKQHVYSKAALGAHKCECKVGTGCEASSSLGVKYCKAGNCSKCTMVVTGIDVIQ